MSRPVLYPHHDCLAHWDTVPCQGCLYEAKEYRELFPWWWPYWRALRALCYRLTVRYAYDLTEQRLYRITPLEGHTDG